MVERAVAEPIKTVRLPPLGLDGILGFPAQPARGLVLFAHGSGSSRFSPRNNYVAAALRNAGLATLLFDLLDPREEANRASVFDVELLTERLLAATDWARDCRATRSARLAYFGASTGAAAALVAAARRGRDIAAIVSRGGRPDLAAKALQKVIAPTLLIVGSLDAEVLQFNRAALHALRGEKALEIVLGATHLFEEPGALDAVVALARRWFLDHCPPLQE